MGAQKSAVLPDFSAVLVENSAVLVEFPTMLPDFSQKPAQQITMLETSFITTVSHDYRRNQNSFNTRKRCSGALQETEIHQSILCLLASYFLNNP
ncbi:MAG: hypothetical protein IKT26_01740 [Bacteroidaceae bacterium]|nr:hypothetical protein [Bacteroidaceae bacterium]